MFGTLLGPEESGPLGWDVSPGVGCLGFSWLPPLPVRGGCRVWGLVGLLFEICIVDASIFCSNCFVVYVQTSYEGHMVDALASRADEGRSSLR